MIDAYDMNSSSAEVPHQIESRLKNAGYHYRRPVMGIALGDCLPDYHTG